MSDEIHEGCEVRFLGDVKRLALKPGDMLVLSSDDILSDEVCARLKADLDRVIPGHRVVVLSGGIKLGVIECPAP